MFFMHSILDPRWGAFSVVVGFDGGPLAGENTGYDHGCPCIRGDFSNYTSPSEKEGVAKCIALSLFFISEFFVIKSDWDELIGKGILIV
jgi:hypothetical protein